MAKEQKKGILSKIFGTQTSCCCNMRIEEVSEEEPAQRDNGGQAPSCCGATKINRNKK